MTCITIIPPSGELDERPTAKRFRRPHRSGRAVPEVVDREARITLLAFRAHDDRAEALAFLNSHHDGLGGRVIEVAGASDEGLAAATDLIVAIVPASPVR